MPYFGRIFFLSQPFLLYSAIIRKRFINLTHKTMDIALYEQPYGCLTKMERAAAWLILVCGEVFSEELPIGLETMVDGVLLGMGLKDPEFQPKEVREEVADLLKTHLNKARYWREGVVVQSLPLYFGLYEG